MAANLSTPNPLEYIVVFGPKGNCTLELCPLEWSVYGYRPNLGANITLIVLYALSAAVHIYLGVIWKTWFFMACMLLGALSAVIGYIGRVLMFYNPFNFAAFLLQIICVGSCPVYYTAAIYVTLSATIKYFSPELSRFNPNIFYWAFIPCDMFCLVLQAAGGALSVVSSGTSQAGVDLALVGLGLQVLALCVFSGFYIDYLANFFRSPQYRTRVSAEKKRSFKIFLGFMGLATLLILIRCAYRLAELHEGYKGSTIRNESPFIVLEGVMVIVAVYCLMVGHPGLVFSDKKQSTKVEAIQSRDCIQLL